MTHAADLPAWAAWIVALLLLLGAGITLIGSLGLLRLRGFYQRAHAPTLGTTLGTAFIIGASMLCFSLLQMRPLLHEVLILGFVTITTPVTLMLLVRAALFRDTAEGRIEDHGPHGGPQPSNDE
ncbi:monovalent cation/H(+) antiporter subunit G [Rhodopseudomonas palustris]|uniref:Monovalent cation/H(+) antiporter subunit G n=1 Tax=Rhodopseudomonas palustris (strain ATCC BAA-98 / CGA009) TaxID=258594 RepID=A0AAE9Y073_RHOPA|nr:monovalent cation/H(+) antiporter subunit G [Rhodopseudomonas palustris]ACF01639.1 monovalent cation/proton antiporter, MnhG/PhaG subunit [Rhodopseudomonas palustris TIE-1]OPF89978.1 potassium:proton antiporter [Rhodopseudomonas palustris]PPQ45496.1 potassium:proton antiporter [Rhodopseudomonas palustris]QLH71854.1 cation:proton antiporter [Rhodopseudomonas palustris]RIA01062.1 potassium:proton antiporter [Rhodopseudomonas palustris]